MKPGISLAIDSLRNAAQIDQWHRENGMLAFSLRESKPAGIVVDVLVRPVISFESQMANALPEMLFSRRAMIASIDDLLSMKRVANRPKGQLDIITLMKIKRGEDPNA